MGGGVFPHYTDTLTPISPVPHRVPPNSHVAHIGNWLTHRRAERADVEGPQGKERVKSTQHRSLRCTPRTHPSNGLRGLQTSPS